MRKLFKYLFSRFALISLIILLQVACIGYLIYAFNENSVYYLVIVYLITALFTVIVMVKDVIPEYKLPWIMTFLFIPGLGVVIYLLFGRIKLRKKDRKKFETIEEWKRNVTKSNLDIQSIEDVKVKQIFHYLNDYTKLGAYQNTKIKYFSMGEDFLPSYLEDLKKAEKYIFLEYFIVSRGKGFDQILDILVDKVASGVEVKMMYDDFGSMFYVKYSFDKKMRQKGIDCKAFNRFRPFLSYIFNNRDHRKITIIDGKVAYTGGLNLSDEYFNYIEKFGKWKDNAIRLEGQAVNNLNAMFIEMFDGEKKDVYRDFNKYINNDFEKDEEQKGLCFPYPEAPNPVYEDKIAKNVYLHLINNAKKTINIMTPYFIVDYEILDSLLNACKKGIQVNVLIPNIPDKKIIYDLTCQTCQKLFTAGANIYKYTPGFVHSKMILVDDEIAVVGTINFDYRSLIHNFEDAVLMYKVDAIEDIKNDFESTFAISYKMEKADFKVNIIKKFAVSIISIFSPLF